MPSYKRGQLIRISLPAETTPDATPQIEIQSGQGTQVIAPTAMSGAKPLYYYDYTVPAGAVVGSWHAIFTWNDGGDAQSDTFQFDVSINDLDDISSQITAISGGTGIRSIVFHVKDGSAVDIQGATVSVHNSSNDDSPQLGTSTTDASGNTATLNIDDGSYKVRVTKAGAIESKVETVTVTQSETIEITITNISITPPADGDLCRLYLFPVTLGDVDITNLANSITISSKDKLTKIDGKFIENSEANFTYDSSTDPDSYYFDAYRGSEVYISAPSLGIGHTITVPAEATKDLKDLIV